MKVLVTGGAGFIGSNLVKTLNAVSPSTKVRVLDDLSTGLPSNLDGCLADFHLGSILDFSLLKNLTEDCDAVIHLAAIGSVPRSIKFPRNSHDANITGTLNVLEAARETGTEYIVVASSSSVYGANPNLPKSESDWTRPLSPYGVTKLATESYALAYANSYGLKVLPLRFFNVYGPFQQAQHDYAAVIPSFISGAISAQRVEIYGDGLQTRDFTFVEDVCDVIVRSVMGSVSADSAINLAFGTRYSLLELASIIEEELGSPLLIEHRPPRASDVRDSSADNSKLKELFPGLKRTHLRAGIKETVSWFLNNDKP